MIHNSLAANFKANGLSYGQSNAELIVAYTVIYQEPGMTTQTTKYSGYNIQSEEILEMAHMKGAVNSGRPDYFEQAGIIIDIRESATSKLVFRNVVKGDVVRGVSDSTRASRINNAIAEGLAPFFRK